MGAESSKLSHPAGSVKKCPGKDEPSMDAYNAGFKTSRVKAMAAAVAMFLGTVQMKVKDGDMEYEKGPVNTSLHHLLSTGKGGHLAADHAGAFGCTMPNDEEGLKELFGNLQKAFVGKSVKLTEDMDANTLSSHRRISLAYTVVAANESQSKKVSAPAVVYVADEEAFKRAIKAFGGGDVSDVPALVKEYTLAVAAMCKALAK